MTLLSRRSAVSAASVRRVSRSPRRHQDFLTNCRIVLATLAFVVLVGTAGLLAVHAALH
jgi:hypothetical protein